MSDRAPDPLGADYVRLSVRQCPHCGSDLDRVRRRLIDRFLSVFVSLQRYRCRSFTCRWEGTLRVKPKDAQSSSLQ